MGLFSRLTQPNQETSIQIQKRLLDEAMAADSEVRFGRAFMSVAVPLMKEYTQAMRQEGDAEACLRVYVLGCILDDAGGARESQVTRDMKTILLQVFSQDTFEQYVRSIKYEVISRISDTLTTLHKGMEEMPRVSAEDSSYMDAVRRGCSKAKAIYENAQQCRS